MRLVSDYISLVVKGLNPNLKENNDFDFTDNIGSHCQNFFDIDFGEFDITEGDQWFDIGTPFSLIIYFSYEKDTKTLYYDLVEQAKTLTRSLLLLSNYENTDITKVVVNSFNIEKLETNHKLLTLTVNGQATVNESL
tara:strand:+ start:210 stop:620 length:411 start_codon:yes stop_codon:yes gene_type:complete